MDQKSYRVEEVASLLGLSALTIYRRIKDRSIGSIRIGRSIRIPSSEVKRLTEIESSEHRAAGGNNESSS
jgi:excisionase family DNA binding protein